MLNASGCSRRLAANWTSATEPTISSAQNASVRSTLPQLNSRGGGVVGRFVMSGQARDVRQVPKILRMIQSIPHKKRRGCIKTNKRRLTHQLRGDMLVQQRADIEAARLPLAQQRHQPVERAPRVHDVLDQKDVFPLQSRR